MLRFTALPDAARRPRRELLRGGSALACALIGLFAATDAFAQPAPTRRSPGASMPAPVQPDVPQAQPGAAQAQPSLPPQPGGFPAQPGVPQTQSGAAPVQPGAFGAPPPAPNAQPGYPPPGYPGGYGPYGGYYPPPGYYYPQIQPIPPAPPPTPMRRRSTGMMVGGIALTASGVVGLVLGTVFSASASARYEIYCDYGGYTGLCETRDDEPLQTAGTVITIAGVALLGAGIPLLIIGAKKVPVRSDAPEIALQPKLSFGPGSAVVRMAF